jgi:hypothetical protein
MPRSKIPKGPPAQRLQHTKWYYLSAPKVLASIVGAIGLTAGVATLWPRVTVEPEGQVDPSNPTAMAFRITNTGFIPLKNVEPGIGICGIQGFPAHDLADQCKGQLGPIFVMPQWAVKTLARDEQTEVRLDDLFKFQTMGIGAADVSINVSFNPWLIPYRYQVEFRFRTRPESDGKLSWIPRPLDK